MSWNEGPKAFTAGAGLLAKRRVKIAAGTTTTPPEVVYAGAGEAYVGITERDSALGELVSVKLRNQGGTFEVAAAGAFAVGADLYGTANGQVDDVVSGAIQFTAVESATAAGDIVEVLPV
ncbi:MAG: capsid cement protein [bacterium]|jgi:hypothetical protein